MHPTEQCPRCRGWSEKAHCASPSCPWWRCARCRIVFSIAPPRSIEVGR